MVNLEPSKKLYFLEATSWDRLRLHLKEKPVALEPRWPRFICPPHVGHCSWEAISPFFTHQFITTSSDWLKRWKKFHGLLKSSIVMSSTFVFLFLKPPPQYFKESFVFELPELKSPCLAIFIKWPCALQRIAFGFWICKFILAFHICFNSYVVNMLSYLFIVNCLLRCNCVNM